MVISAKLIKKPRKTRYCDDCNILIETSVLRLYGYGCDGDPPYVLYLHPKEPCMGRDPKITKALEAANKPINPT